MWKKKLISWKVEKSGVLSFKQKIENLKKKKEKIRRITSAWKAERGVEY